MTVKKKKNRKYDLENMVISHRLVKWRSLEWLQNENLKEITEESLEKLKSSLVNNNFIQPFNVWQDAGKKIWILDGHHRQKAMQLLETEGVKIPDKVPANFIACRNKKQAAKFVLLYNSNYASMTEYGLKEFMAINDLLLEDIQSDISMPQIDLSMLIPPNDEGYGGEIEMVETAKNLADVYIVIGEYRILLQRDRYLTWIDELKLKIGFDKTSVMKELLKRLKIK